MKLIRFVPFARHWFRVVRVPVIQLACWLYVGASAVIAQTVVTNSTLPFAGSTNFSALDRFLIFVSTNLSGASVSNSSSFQLFEAGTDGLFGTGDDVTYPINAFVQSGNTVVLVVNNGPLQPGRYRFQTTTNLLDANSNSVTIFSRDFVIANPLLGKIENTSNNTLPEATELPLTESPSGTGFFTAMGVGSFLSTSDVDYWRFTAQAGDLLTARLEADATGIYPQLYLQNAADGNLVAVGGDNSGVAQFQNYQFSASGTYYLRVWSSYGAAHYRMRVDLARGLSLESEPNDIQLNANVLATSPVLSGTQGRVAGSLVSTDTSGDYFIFFSSRRRHTRLQGDWSSDVCSSDLSHHGIQRRGMAGRSGALRRIE